jgi:hypothetical protein
VALALTEEILAKVLIRGSGLSPKAQSKLLRKLAHAVDPPPRRNSFRPKRVITSAAKRARGRERWHAWQQRHQAGQAIAPVTYGGVVLAKLIMAGWLSRNDAEVYPTKAVGEAISTLCRRSLLERSGHVASATSVGDADSDLLAASA